MAPIPIPKLDLGFGSQYRNLVLVPSAETWFRPYTIQIRKSIECRKKKIPFEIRDWFDAFDHIEEWPFICAQS